MTPKAVTACLLAGLLTGCSSVTVIKNPTASDTGIRYWRPKPYLLVTPADATGRMVKLKLEYLPDYSEEYSIHPQGKKPPQVQLKDGWNLVAVGGPAPPPEKPEEAAAPPPPPAGDPMKLPEYVVAATNVPIGYYESVFDSTGTKKFLKGWRYIGASPLSGGNPIGMDPKGLPNGGLPPGCPPPTPGSVLPGPLYGMVFFNGVMTFRQLDEIANNMTCPQYVKLTPDAPTPPQPTAEMQPGASPSPKAETTPGDAEPLPPGSATTEPGESSNPQPKPPSTSTPPESDASASNEAPTLGARHDDKLIQASAPAPAAAKAKIPPPRVWGAPNASH
jgi:hypothetical protein